GREKQRDRCKSIGDEDHPVVPGVPQHNQVLTIEVLNGLHAALEEQLQHGLAISQCSARDRVDDIECWFASVRAEDFAGHPEIVAPILTDGWRVREIELWRRPGLQKGDRARSWGSPTRACLCDGHVPGP